MDFEVNHPDESARTPTRAHSIVGTWLFMAPEMLLLYSKIGRTKTQEDSYTKAVDYWSLGIMIYKMLTGQQAYIGQSQDTFQAIFPAFLSNHAHYYDAFMEFFGEVDYNICNGILDEHSRSIIRGLLEFHADHRLGYDAADMQTGFNALMNHAFFSSIDWTLLESKQIPPPYIPHEETLAIMLVENWNPGSISDLLIDANRYHWCAEFEYWACGDIDVHVKYQHYFNKWYYSS